MIIIFENVFKAYIIFFPFSDNQSHIDIFHGYFILFLLLVCEILSIVIRCYGFSILFPIIWRNCSFRNGFSYFLGSKESDLVLGMRQLKQ